MKNRPTAPQSEIRRMTRRKLNFSVLALGLGFMALNAAIKAAAAHYHITDSLPLGLLSVVGAAPVAAAFLLINRYTSALANDEYQQHLITRQALAASMATLLFMAIFGFWFSNSAMSEGANSGYTRYVFFWFLIWFASGFQKQYSE